MLITQLIAELETIKEKHGNLECFVSTRNFGCDRIFDFKVKGAFYDSGAISPDCLSVATPGAAMLVIGYSIGGS